MSKAHREGIVEILGLLSCRDGCGYEILGLVGYSGGCGYEMLGLHSFVEISKLSCAALSLYVSVASESPEGNDMVC